MKLATLKDGSSDGQLVVVSRNLLSAHYATGIANHMQQVLADWNFYAPQLQDLYVNLNQGKARQAFAFDPRQCMAPLPRSYLLAIADPTPTASKATGQPCPLRLGFSDTLLGPCEPLCGFEPAWSADFAAGLAVVTGNVAQAVSPTQALEAVRLLMLVSHTWYRSVPDTAMLTWAAQPSSRFSPVAVTPDELTWAGDTVWINGRVDLTLNCTLNGRKLGRVPANAVQTPGFGDLLASICQIRGLRSGSIVCNGEVRHAEPEFGACSLTTRRERAAKPLAQTSAAWLTTGDTLSIDMPGRDGQSVFGAISHDVR